MKKSDADQLDLYELTTLFVLIDNRTFEVHRRAPESHELKVLLRIREKLALQFDNNSRPKETK